MNNNKFEGIKNRLKSWAEAEAKPLPGLSYSDTTIESRMMEHGCITSNTAVRTIPAYQPCSFNLEIDQAVYNLNKFQRRMVFQKYVEDIPDVQCIEISNRSKSSYYAEMDSIYSFIAGWIKYSLK